MAIDAFVQHLGGAAAIPRGGHAGAAG